MTLSLIGLWLQAASLELGWILAGFGALAAGLGIFRAGFALGKSAGEITRTFQEFAMHHNQTQEQLISLAQEAVTVLPLIATIQEGQEQMRITMRAMNRKLNRLTGADEGME